MQIGQTRTPSKSPGLVWGHPHTGGANHRLMSGQDAKTGTPPYNWGQPGPGRFHQGQEREIPMQMGQTSSGCDHSSPGTAHPHAGGANPGPHGHRSLNSGTSPCKWGKPFPTKKDYHKSQSIKTRHQTNHAGPSPRYHRVLLDGEHPAINSSPQKRGCPTPQVSSKSLQRSTPQNRGDNRHSLTTTPPARLPPRAGGDPPARQVVLRGNDIPPPRQRGNYPITTRPRSCPRHIPIHMGQTRDLGPGVHAGRGHPHAYGATSSLRWQEPVAQDPSPTRWGKHYLLTRPHDSHRKIPIRMGQTRTPNSDPFAGKGDPHAHGANRFSLCPGPDSLGRSPSAWGKQPLVIPGAPIRRKIPIRMGQTVLRQVSVSFIAENPHTHGANPSTTRPLPCGCGRSPPAWGKHEVCSHQTQNIGEIPTRMGQASQEPRDGLCYPEHPHPHGASNCQFHLCCLRYGTSPPAWGKPRIPALLLHRPGNIPTRMGQALNNR